MQYFAKHQFAKRPLANAYHGGCDLFCNLSVPCDEPLSEILVEVSIAPQNAICEIYGLAANGESLCVVVTGAYDEVVLPFVSPQICVRHDDDVVVRIATIGHKGVLH